MLDFASFKLEISDFFKHLKYESHGELIMILLFVMLIFFIASYFFYYQGKNFVRNENVLTNMKQSSDLKLDLIKYLAFANFSKDITLMII